MQEKKNRKLKRVLALAGISLLCVGCFALALWLGIQSQMTKTESLHTLSPAEANAITAQPKIEFEGLDVQVTTSSNEVNGVLRPEEILPFAQETAQRVFGRQFTEFVMLDCYEDSAFDAAYVWRVYAYTGKNAVIDMRFDAQTGRDLSCVDGLTRSITPADVQNQNVQNDAGWNAYTPVAPAEYLASPSVFSAPEILFSDSAAQELQRQAYESLRAEVLAYRIAHKNDTQLQEACAFAASAGLLGDALIEEAWLALREETDSPFGYAEFSTFEIRLSSGEWLVLGASDEAGFFFYERPKYTQLELYEREMINGGGNAP